MPCPTYSRFLAIAGLSLLAATASAQRIYCYDDGNRRICGSSFPPEAAQYDRVILNEQGVVIAREQGEITAEERAALEEQRQREDELARQAEERRRYGQLLLDSYSKVEDIEALRDRMLQQIQQQIAIIENYLEGLNEKLADLERRAERFAPYSDAANAPPLPNNIRLDIERTESSISLFEQRLDDSRKDQIETRENFQRDIDYFRELKGEDA